MVVHHHSFPLCPLQELEEVVALTTEDHTKIVLNMVGSYCIYPDYVCILLLLSSVMLSKHVVCMGRPFVHIVSMHYIVGLLCFTQDEVRDKEGEAGHVPGHTSEVQYAPTARGMEAGVWNRLVMHAVPIVP